MKQLLFLIVCFGLLGCDTSFPSENSVADQSLSAFLDQAEKYQNSSPDSTVFFAKKALEKAEFADNRAAAAYAKNMLATAYFQVGSLNKATELLHESLAVFKELGISSRLAVTCELLGQVYMQSENYTLATLNFNEALLQYEQSSDEKGKARMLGMLGHVCEKTLRYDSALSYQKQALSYFIQKNDSLNLPGIYDNIGSIYEDLEQYDLAEANFRKAYRINQRLGIINDLIINTNNLGDIGRKTGDPASAVVYYHQAMNLAKKHHIKYQQKSAAKDLSKVYELTRQPDSALFYLNISHELTEELFSAQMANELANAHSVYELDQKQEQILMLKKERAVSRRITLIVSISAMALVVLIAAFFYQTLTKVRQQRRLLITENELSKVELVNTQLSQEKLAAELENKQLKEEQLQKELGLKSNSLTRSALHLVQKNELLDHLRDHLKKIKKAPEEDIPRKVRKLIKTIDLNFSLDDDWQEFESIFQQVHTSFFDQLKHVYPHLSPSEVRLCAMIRLNLHSKEIATIMGISNDSLRIARYRLRKKLGLKKGANLYSFILNLDSQQINI
ncbi:MAG: tetratricopeptide repeat protein [Marinoscillum sp.]|uniref:tetratricopeptide repeat protein n=1 Tax=Marinoscillum sp. TaxID=2024838 RepID=UPI0032F530B6